VDTDGRCRAPQGNVAVQAPIQPAYAHTAYSCFRLFMPYDQLHLPRGRHRLRLVVGVVGPGQKLVATSSPVSFWVREF
jgi:hypothetical protein